VAFLKFGLDHLIDIKRDLIGINLVLFGMKFYLFGITPALIGIKYDLIGLTQFSPYLTHHSFKKSPV